jgi:hypothetical protein
MEEINLSVPYISQFDEQANEDAADACGPTSAAMVLNFFGEQTTPNEFFEKTGAQKGQLITISQMRKAIISYGYTSEYKIGCTVDDILVLLKEGVAPIVLVHYENLHSREDTYKGAHFMVIDGIRSDTIFANDPDFFAQFKQDGDHHAYTMSDFLIAWSNCHLDGNPDNSLLVIYPKDKQPQTAQVEAAIVDGSIQSKMSFQDRLDAADHRFLKLTDALNITGIDDRDAMVDQALKKLDELKSVNQTETDQLIAAKEEANKTHETVLKLMAENGTLKNQKQVLADQISEIEKDDSASVAVGRAAIQKLNDIKSGQTDVASLVKARRNSWYFIGQAIIVMKNQYEATIIELKKKLEEKRQVTPDLSQKQKGTGSGYFDWFSW